MRLPQRLRGESVAEDACATDLTDCFTIAEHTAFINATVSEALRCARTAAADSGSAPAVMPFQWSFFEGSYSANESERTRVGAGRVALPPSLMPLPFTVSQAAGAQAVMSPLVFAVESSRASSETEVGQLDPTGGDVGLPGGV